MPVRIRIKRTYGNNYPTILRLGRNLTTADRATILTGAIFTLTVNGVDVAGTLQSAAEGTVQFPIPDTVYNLAAGDYALRLAIRDGQGYDRDLAVGTWRQLAEGASI